ncbi:putative glyoxalase superfamily protein PhnB [Chryseobacterium bernardetii]|uniref:Catechol 2,3-dioxygenase-like lactoylglutathione lyase family enzyme n=2 Tax=Chryseobacterium TaxID=59732 RepID=A0A543EMJ9_9FLAO|nr:MULTISPECIES: VOC family protein [Chryseobacterium]MDR6369144.1 putative glyoxalase superfamily protein PhnB [Chryseobacterium vietnamense]MDR6439933.1 putative glyoxalase superfamily protein PhnB [Chryseobacterium bernardetii]TQM22749.1 catechol 2,3-dioxygenase-like lactoylglutathione lyase family enzyme [Chryseobacterium aquifrigidense]
MIKFKYVILYVEDVEQSMNFYKNTFDSEIKFITPEKDYGELLTGETSLSFASVSLANSNIKKGFITAKTEDQPFGMELGFTTNDVESLVEKAIQSGAVLYEDIAIKPWGQKTAYIKDPNNYLVEICTEIQ